MKLAIATLALFVAAAAQACPLTTAAVVQQQTVTTQTVQTVQSAPLLLAQPAYAVGVSNFAVGGYGLGVGFGAVPYGGGFGLGLGFNGGFGGGFNRGFVRFNGRFRR